MIRYNRLAKSNTKFLSIAIVVLVFSGCKNKVEVETDVNQATEKQLDLDSLTVIKELQISTPNQVINIDKDQILLPFNYSVDYSTGTYIFKWNLCDLIIDSDSANYSHYSFENNIPYKGYIGFEGKLHIVETSDSTAISTEKFKKNHSELYNKIYYSDLESIIFRTKRGAIAVLYFKYLKGKRSFSLFYKENEDLGFEATEGELLDIALSQLRVAKNLYKENHNRDLTNWNNYKNSLSILDKRVFKIIYNDILNSIDTLNTDIVHTPKIDGNWGLVSIINVGDEGNKLWSAINRIPQDKKIDFENIYNTALSDQIAFLRSHDNFIKTDYRDDSTLILTKENSYSKWIGYAVFRKEIIKNKEVIIFTGGSQNYGKINSKEMAYFYLNLFKNYEAFAGMAL